MYSAIEFCSSNAKKENPGTIIFLPEFAHKIFRDNSLKRVKLNYMQRRIKYQTVEERHPTEKAFVRVLAAL